LANRQALDVWLFKPKVKGGTNYRFFFLHWCIVFGKIIGIIWFALSTNGQPSIPFRTKFLEFSAPLERIFSFPEKIEEESGTGEKRFNFIEFLEY
jgi:hypothetical protein